MPDGLWAATSVGVLTALVSLRTMWAGFRSVGAEGRERSRDRQWGLATLVTSVGITWMGLTARVPTYGLSLVVLLGALVLHQRHRARGGRGRQGLLVLGLLIAIWTVGARVTEISPTRLATGYPKVSGLFRAFTQPEFFDAVTDDQVLDLEVLTPCPVENGDLLGAETPATEPVDGPTGASVPPDGKPRNPPTAVAGSDGGPTITVVPGCAPLGATLTVSGSGLSPGSPVEIVWENPTGDRSIQARLAAGSGGAFVQEVVIPVRSIPEPYRDRVQRQTLIVRAQGNFQGYAPSDAFGKVLDGMAVTLALGLLATVFGAALAVPVSVLGARNLMRGSVAADAVYYAVRGGMNVLRSIEPLILAVVFVVWVGQGPFAGLLALSAHSVAALGKLYSEAIESVDPNPVEAIRATGASWVQVVDKGVLPQVVPPFTAFTVYRTDINVRMSTILGVVGAGGIGEPLVQWISKAQWSEAATALIVIAVVVMLLDYASAQAREVIMEGRRARGIAAKSLRWIGERRWLKAAGYAALITLVAWAWRVAEVEPSTLTDQAEKVIPIVTELTSPNLLARQTVTQTSRATLTVPCPAGADGEEAGELASEGPGTGGPQLAFDLACADPGDEVAVVGTGFTPGSAGFLRWLVPDRGRLGAGRVSAAADGGFQRSVEIRPILAGESPAGRAALLTAELSEPVGSPGLSPASRTTLALLGETVLMAFMAMSLGAVIAFPLGMLGARNLMPRTSVGNAVYYVVRTWLNLLRSIEPLILAAVFAAWVGVGSPFAGVLAIIGLTVANLGKLFSEAVEDIDPGPIEAMAATGAGRFQQIVHGVVPQIVPPFVSFGVYQWDINVRVSTIVGFVGGGGIGVVVQEWMNQLQWSNAAVAILGIVAVVWAMDVLSAKTREALI